MEISTILLLFLLPLSTATTTPYLSPNTIFKNYETMLSTFKIFIYTPQNLINFPNPPLSLFYNSLIQSQFLTQDPNEAHLFFIPFPPSTNARSIARVVRNIRNNHPYWNRTLGADHFFISPTGIDYSSDRNILELKKNSVQISTFPVTSGYFIPHKDITLPPVSTSPKIEKVPETTSYLGYLRWDGITESKLVTEIKEIDEFLVDEDESQNFQSKFCLFFYGGDVSWMVDAMAKGCVPVVIVDRPIQDLPLMDVLKWSEMTILVKVQSGRRLKEVLLDGISEEKHLEMRELGVAGSKHLVWNADPQPLDAFHMVMYQLWMRRHVVRYARREFIY